MKENKVAYPRESRIAGHTKQSNMTEDAEIVVGRTGFWPERVGHV